MCRFCCPNSPDNVIHYDENNIPYYLHETMEWDDYNDGFVYNKIYINYCPWCGKRLIEGEYLGTEENLTEGEEYA